MSNDCVIIPNFGGFMAHYVPARYDETDNSFLPPLRTLGFNPQLRLNDHLLVQSYIEAYDISYPEALRRISNEVEELKQTIRTEGEFQLNGIGTLRLNEEGNYEFSPCEAGILTPSLYGLSSFEFMPLMQVAEKDSVREEATEKEVTSNAEEISLQHDASTTSAEESAEDEKTNDTLVISMSWVRSAVAAAAAILLFFVYSTPVSNSSMDDYQESNMLPIAATQSVQKMFSDNGLLLTTTTENEAVTTDTTSTDNTAVEEESKLEAENKVAEETKVAEEATPSYTIVLASETTRYHAEEFVARLAKKGIEATVTPMKFSEKVRVTYGSYTSDEEVHDQLRQLRTQYDVFHDAWVLNNNR